MAATKGQSLFGYPAPAGGKVIDVMPIAGPTTYTPGLGQLFNYTAQYRSVDWVGGGVSVSGLYNVIAKPAAYGQQKVWRLRWILISNGLESGNVDLSGETVQLAVIAS